MLCSRKPAIHNGSGYYVGRIQKAALPSTVMTPQHQRMNDKVKYIEKSHQWTTHPPLPSSSSPSQTEE